MERLRPRGGFRRPVQLSLWLRDKLADGHTTWGQQLYGEYSAEMKKIPLARGKGKRKVISRGGFSQYLYVLRRLNLIQYTGEEEPAREKGLGAEALFLVPRRMFKIVSGSEGSSAWNNIWEAYEGIK